MIKYFREGIGCMNKKILTIINSDGTKINYEILNIFK